MSDTVTALSVINDGGYQYDLMEIPKQDAPLIKEASKEILQDMQVEGIIQNLENVARMMFVAYNALGGTLIQSQMSKLQKKYLDLMDKSGQTITTFKEESKSICTSMKQAYGWLLKGKETLAVSLFDKCAQSAGEMAAQAEKLATGFGELSDQTETVLEKTQEEQALQYKQMDELKKAMNEYDANLKECVSLRDSLEADLKDVNQAYQDARKKEQSAYDMKKALMITQIVTSCIGAVIPSTKSMQKGESGGNQATQQAQDNLNQKEQEKSQLEDTKKSQQATLDQLKEKKAQLEKQKQDIQEKIQMEEAATAEDPAQRQANLEKFGKELEEVEAQLKQVDGEIQKATKELDSTGIQLDQVSSAIENLNKQLSAYADQCRDDLERAEAAAQKALETKLKMEQQRREALASIQKFTVMIQNSVSQKKTAETAVQTLQTAIGCIKQVVVALTTAAKFWRSMEAYCKTLSKDGLGQTIAFLSQGLTLEERQEYYTETEFMMTYLVYVCRWAALYYVCDDYYNRNKKVRKMVENNILSSGSRETEWELAGKLAEEMGVSIQAQVDQSNQVIQELGEGSSNG